MNRMPFFLNSQEDVSNFEQQARNYSESHHQMAIQNFSLVEAYKICQNRNDGNKLFAAFFDVYINITLLYADLHSAGAIWNRTFSKGKLEGGSILNCEKRYFGKMEIHRYLSSFVLRYRAFLDKLMGLWIQIYVPEKYERFIKAKSRRIEFKKLITGVSQFSDEFIHDFDKSIEKFDNLFRTPEAHGTGTLRKWTFSMESINDDPQLLLIDYWNRIILLTEALGKNLHTANAS